jgi:hypothetical protein
VRASVLLCSYSGAAQPYHTIVELSIHSRSGFLPPIPIPPCARVHRCTCNSNTQTTKHRSRCASWQLWRASKWALAARSTPESHPRTSTSVNSCIKCHWQLPRENARMLRRIHHNTIISANQNLRVPISDIDMCEQQDLEITVACRMPYVMWKGKFQLTRD